MASRGARRRWRAQAARRQLFREIGLPRKPRTSGVARRGADGRRGIGGDRRPPRPKLAASMLVPVIPALATGALRSPITPAWSKLRSSLPRFRPSSPGFRATSASRTNATAMATISSGLRMTCWEIQSHTRAGRELSAGDSGAGGGRREDLTRLGDDTIFRA
jgi:hypothetical protein